MKVILGTVAAQLGVLLLIVLAYSIIFPDRPLPGVRSRAGRMTLDVSNTGPPEIIRPVIRDRGYHVETIDGETTIYGGATVENPTDEDLGPHYITFQFTDRSGEAGRIVTVPVADIPAEHSIDVAVEATWLRDDEPAALSVQTVGASFDEPAVGAADLVTNIESTSGNDGRTVTGTITNRTDRTASRTRIHCVYRANAQIVGGVTARIDPVSAGATRSWQIDIPTDFDEVTCSGLDSPSELGG